MKKNIPNKLWESFLEYAVFLFTGYSDPEYCEKIRCEKHQAVFKCLNGDRIRNRNTRIGKFIDSLVSYTFKCPVCGSGISNKDVCFNCQRQFNENDIIYNITILKEIKKFY